MLMLNLFCIYYLWKIIAVIAVCILFRKMVPSLVTCLTSANNGDNGDVGVRIVKGTILAIFCTALVFCWSYIIGRASDPIPYIGAYIYGFYVGYNKF